MIRMGLSGFEIMATLVAFGFGFVVLYLASKSEGSLKKMGQVMGMVIIVLSGIALLLDLYIGIMIAQRMMSPRPQQKAEQAAPAPRQMKTR